MSIVRARAVTRTFGDTTAVDRVDLDVEAGEVVALLGANGAGKTTLIRMLLGLSTPTSGSVRLFGEPPSRSQRRRIGYVPQNLGLYGDLTVGENLRFRAEVFGVGTGAGAGASGADGEWGGQLVGQLPHGLQRRAAFAAALQHDPALLVLDEPTSGVSPLARSELWDLIRRHAERDAAVLVSTHYMDEAVQADRLVVMSRGKVVAAGSVDEVIGGRMAVTVDADRWADAFVVLDCAGRQGVLAGRTIRLPLPQEDAAAAAAELDVVRALLADAGVAASVGFEAATLDETMVELGR